MPNLQHNAEYERCMTLSAMRRCPRLWQAADEQRRGLLPDDPPKTGLTVGILAHVGLANLWTQRLHGAKPWVPSLALDAIDAAPEAAAAVLSILKDGPTQYQALRKGLVEYAEQWIGARDHWSVLSVAPEDVPPLPWAVVEGRYVAYPDLIVTTPTEPVLVVDHKTSAFRFEATDWEWHPELLTQCLAAQQLQPGESVWYTVDFLQKPSYKTTIWSFPATPLWEFTAEKEATARAWVREGLRLVDDYRARGEWPKSLACQSKFGVCGQYERCFGGGE